jgi:hypothetical protein
LERKGRGRPEEQQDLHIETALGQIVEVPLHRGIDGIRNIDVVLRRRIFSNR